MDKKDYAMTETWEKKERLWNGGYCRAMVGNFMLFFSFYLLTPLLPIYLDAQFAADKDVMGLVLSGYVVAALLVRPFSGFIVDTFDRKKVLAICFFFFFILFTGYIGAGTLLMFALVAKRLEAFDKLAGSVSLSNIDLEDDRTQYLLSK